MTERKEKYNDIIAYGLLPYLRAAVAAKRKNRDEPSRDTVWRAYNHPEDSLTGLHQLILRTGLELLETHEREIEAVLQVS